MTNKAYTYTLEAVLCAVLVLLCIMFVIGNIQVPRSEGDLKGLGKDAAMIMANNSELLVRGESDEFCDELEMILPPGTGYYLGVKEYSNGLNCSNGTDIIMEQGGQPKYPMTASHYLVAVNKNESLCLYDIEIVLWWR